MVNKRLWVKKWHLKPFQYMQKINQTCTTVFFRGGILLDLQLSSVCWLFKRTGHLKKGVESQEKPKSERLTGQIEKQQGTFVFVLLICVSNGSHYYTSIIFCLSIKRDSHGFTSQIGNKKSSERCFAAAFAFKHATV